MFVLPHLVASGGLISAKWDQCINNARYTRSNPLPTQTQWHGDGDMTIQPIGTNHKAANMAILLCQVDLHTTYSVEISRKMFSAAGSGNGYRRVASVLHGAGGAVVWADRGRRRGVGGADAGPKYTCMCIIKYIWFINILNCIC